jgi:hypothetical protein
MTSALERDVRWLKGYAALSSLALAVLLLAGFARQQATPQRPRFTELDVERLNVVDRNGQLVLVLANRDRIPPPVVGGHVFPRQNRAPGMIFYNGKGDENGGLTFDSTALPDGGYTASAGLLFDQYNQDQTVGLTYSERNGQRSAGLTVWDRSDRPVWEIAGPIYALPEGPEREALVQKLAAAGELGAVRLFAGKRPDKSVQLSLADARGRPRLQVVVTAEGEAKIKFLDENGAVRFELPPSGP